MLSELIESDTETDDDSEDDSDESDDDEDEEEEEDDDDDDDGRTATAATSSVNGKQTTLQLDKVRRNALILCWPHTVMNLTFVVGI